MPASPIDLTTLASAKSWMQVTSVTEDSIIQACITAASRYWMWRTGRGPSNWQVATQSPFNEPVSFTENYDGSGTARLFLRNWPINSVQSLQIYQYVVQQSTSPNSSGWVIDQSARSLSIRLAAGGFFFGRGSSFGGYGWTGGFGASPVFQRGIQNVAVQYTAGFNTVSVTAELDTVPSSSAYTITTDQVWLANTSVSYFSSGDPLTQVSIAPQQGQYYIQSPGVYLFNAADAGQEMLLSYTAAGTPPDITQAVNQMVDLTYKRRGWVGLRSLMMAGVGQTNYSTWEFDASVLSVLNAYTRAALV